MTDHLRTLRDDRTNRTRWTDVIMLYAVPVAVGAAALAGGLRLQGIGEVIGGLAILAGFLFALVIFVFQLRISVTNDPRIPTIGLLPRLIDQLFASVSYAVLVGLATTAVAIAAASTRTTSSKTGDLQPLNSWWSAVLVLLFVHLMLLLGVALRRTRVAYREMRR